MIYFYTISSHNKTRGLTVRPLSMRKISEILRQRFELKLSYRDIARSLNIGSTTIGEYLARARTVGISWPLPEGMSEEDLYNKLFLPSKDIRKGKPKPDWEWVCRERRKKGVTLQLLWREYRDIYSDGLSYSQFCEQYRLYTKAISPVMRQVHKGGEKTFVDYAGMTMPWIDSTTGEIHEAQIFVGCLGASQFIFAEATATQGLPDWIQSHINMWNYFGGVSEVVVPDNLKAGVSKSHHYDPDINANYQHFSEHYGFAIVPARVARAKDKAKAENAVGIIERQILAPLRHITFTSLAEINAAIKPRLAALNNQSFQKMKTSRRELFEAVDKPALKHLPADRYHYAEWVNAKIHIDYHFVFDDHYYCVPYQYIHHPVQIRATSKTVECFYQGKRIAAHARSYERYKFTTLKEHMPPAHRAHAEWGPDRMKRWAKKIGLKTAEFIDHMIASRAFPQQAYRSCLGLLRLGERYGEARLEKACTIALAAGASRYQQVESILKKRLDKAPPTSSQDTPIISNHKNIRGSKYYK
jgi:transposase